MKAAMKTAKRKPKPKARERVARPGSAVGQIVAFMTKHRRATPKQLADIAETGREQVHGRVKAANNDYLRPKGKAIRKNEAGEYVLVKTAQKR